MRQACTRTHQHRRRLSGWRRIPFAAYSVLFALVLPLICWGAYAAPGHPHRTPHFVFVDPLLVAEHTQHAATMTVHTANIHTSTPHTEATNAEKPEQHPVGQATLSLMLFSIMTFVALGLWALTLVEQRYRVLLHRPPFAKSITLPILLPPPRLAYFAP